MEAIPERLARQIDIQRDGCWLWCGLLNRNGYGRTTRTGTRTNIVVHRYVYELLVGPIPDGLQLDHLCRVRHCCNPAHLEPVTQRENLLRGDTLTAASAAATHCPANHPYAGDNLRVTPSGARRCRTCERTRNAERRRLGGEALRAQHRKHDAAYRARKLAARQP